MTSDEQHNQTSKPPKTETSPGKILSAAREQAGLSQNEVAGELYMTLTKVRSLENDDFDRLHSDTFIRGYLRAYANLLKIDVELVMAAYDAQAQRLGLIEAPVLKVAESSGKKTWLFIAIMGFVLVVLWLISIWFFDNKKEPDYPLPATLVMPQENIDLQVSSSAGVAVETAPAEQEDTAPLATLPEAGSGSVQQAESSVSAVVPSTQPATDSLLRKDRAAEKLDELVFAFSEECWLEVSDAQGDVLATQLEPAGSQVTVQGHAPFEVKVGNVQGVSIRLNGQPVSVVPVSGTNVRSLKIGK